MNFPRYDGSYNENIIMTETKIKEKKPKRRASYASLFNNGTELIGGSLFKYDNSTF